MRSKIVYLLLMVVAMLPSLVRGQDNTINAYSVYSMYGLGVLESQGNFTTQAMGGAGVATRSRTSINTLNPASYSAALQKGVLIDLGIQGSVYNSTQEVDGSKLRSRETSTNFNNIAVQIPLMNGLGLGFSINPYSNTGYHLEESFVSETSDYISYTYEGSGTVSLVKFGVGWQIKNGLSVGIAGQYYWGELDREFRADVLNIVSPGTAVSMSGIDKISVSRVKAQIGAQWAPYIKRDKSLTLGATYDLGGDLSPRYVRVVSGVDVSSDNYAQNDTTQISIILPRQLSLGATYNSEKLTLSFDYTYQNWVKNNDGDTFSYSGVEVNYNNVNQLRAGIEYVPRRMDIRKYMNRVSYRAGFRYGGYQYTFGGEKIGQCAVTAGMGLPINMMGMSNINLGFEWSRIGANRDIIVDSEAIGLVKQDCFKFSVGITLFGDDYWFQRPQID